MKKFVAAALAVGFYLAVAGPAAAQTLKTGYISKDLNYLPFFVAQKKGFHAKEIFAASAPSGHRSDGQDLTDGAFFIKFPGVERRTWTN